MTPDTFTISGGLDAWRIWCGEELVASFPSLTAAWLALKASRAAIEQVFS